MTRYTLDAGIGRVTFDRTEFGNAFDIAAARELAGLLESAERDDACTALVIDAAGSVFSAGGDVAAMAGSDDPAVYLHELVGELSRSTSILARFGKPVLCVVSGAVAGAGALFPLLADYIIATGRAKFVSAYASMGLSPDCGVSYLLPRSIGERRAMRFTLGGESIDAAAALEWGLVDEVVAPEELAAAVDTALARCARASRSSVAAARHLQRDLDGLAQHLERERAQIVELARIADTRARLERFTARR